MSSPGPPLPPPIPPSWPPYSEPPRRMAAGGGLALKILIGSAVGMGLGFGTCGMGLVLSGKSSTALEKFAMLGLVLLGISAVGLVVSAIWLVISLILDAVRR